MNQITLIGRLTDHPKITYGANKESITHIVFHFAVPDLSMKKMVRRFMEMKS